MTPVYCFRLHLRLNERHFGSRTNIHLSNLPVFSFKYIKLANRGKFSVNADYNDVIVSFVFLQIVVQFKDVEQVTKERTVKVIPNAIQFHIKNKEKSLTFTSFTHRDKTYKQIYKIWQNALADKVSRKVYIIYINCMQ